MGIVIKKISKKTIISFVSLGGIALALLSRLFFGGSHTNLSNVDNSISKSYLIEPANADIPASPSTCGDDASHDNGGSSDGCR